jgi:hypothetical protein
MIGKMEAKQFVMWGVFGGFFGFHCYNHVKKTPPQPLLQIDNPKNQPKPKIKPRTNLKKTNRKNDCAHKTI